MFIVIYNRYITDLKLVLHFSYRLILSFFGEVQILLTYGALTISNSFPLSFIISFSFAFCISRVVTKGNVYGKGISHWTWGQEIDVVLNFYIA